MATKSVQEMAEEYCEDHDECEFARDAFLAGYEAAKAEMNSLEKPDGSSSSNSSNNSNGWISVKDRLPDSGTTCLVTCHEEAYTIAEYDGIKWTSLNSIAYYHPTVTHWMALPAPPLPGSHS